MPECRTTDYTNSRNIVFKLFVFLIAYLATIGWALSFIHELHWIGMFSLLGLAAAVVLGKRWMTPESRLWPALTEPLSFWPFLLILSLGILGQWLYPPTMLDSLTYRLPQLFIWLQNDSLQHIPISDERINYMPQTWGLATLPLVQLAGDRLVWLWGTASWIILYLLTYDWAFELNGDVKKSRIMAFVASTSTFAVLQGVSSANDLFAGVMALLALRFVLNFEKTRNWREINWAVLSFCMAGGTKPHFAVFGLPLTLWFFFSPSKPWKAFRWAWLPVLLVVWLLCSPVPSFVLNTKTYGTWAGPGQDESIKGKSPVWNIILGTTMIAWQNVQPPVNPAALVYGKRWNAMILDTGLKKLVPRFNLGIAPLALVDSAALGLVTSLLLLAGIITTARRLPEMFRSWRGLAMVAGFISIILALSHFVSGSSGRAYSGFLFFSFPFAMAGWNLLRPNFLKCILYLSLIDSLVTVVLYPSHPLWPVQKVKDQMSRLHYVSVANNIEFYKKYSERAIAGQDLINAIPADDSKVVVLVGEDRPLLPLLSACFQKRKLLFMAPHSTPNDLEALNSRYVIAGGDPERQYPELCNYLQQSGNYEVALQKDYVSKNAIGPEPWILYRRVGKIVNR